MEGLEIYFLKNDSRFANIHLLQTNDTADGAPNSCSYSNVAFNHLDKIINEKRATQFQESFVDIAMNVWFYVVEILKN